MFDVRTCIKRIRRARAARRTFVVLSFLAYRPSMGSRSVSWFAGFSFSGARAQLLLLLLLVMAAVGGHSQPTKPAQPAGALRPSPLDCGTTPSDPAADSMQIIRLFSFVKVVCCDQLDEDCYSGGALPDSCATGGCAHAVDLVEASCRPGGGPTGGTWLDPFLGSAFGPTLDALIAKCAVCNEHGCGEQRAGTELEYAITSQRDDESPLEIDELPSGTLPVYIVDGQDVADSDATNCESCDLNLLGLHECNNHCTSLVAAAPQSTGETCRSSAECAEHAFCTRDFQGGKRSVCQACADCAPASSTQTTTRDVMRIHAPAGQEIRATVESLYLPPHSRLTVVPSTVALTTPGVNVTWEGHTLPSEDKGARVAVSSGGILLIEFYTEQKDRRLPQTFRISINPCVSHR
jgi:hypothetical protein